MTSSIENFIGNLLAQMTLEEKIGQLKTTEFFAPILNLINQGHDGLAFSHRNFLYQLNFFSSSSPSPWDFCQPVGLNLP